VVISYWERRAAWGKAWAAFLSEVAFSTGMAYTENMADVVYKDKFIWDAAKNELNKEKHPGISFELATEVFDDPYAVEVYDGGPKNSLLDEERFNVIGTTAIGVINGQYITVSITYRGRYIRIFSARKADPTEIRRYNESLAKFLEY
jgi:uncharacterized DUF497 family protein